ncbi:MAG: hypothetical protein OXG61_00350 [Chloroflexi bacterium]|nr:hypothetical protein [Chloroflexota bacterium]
MFTSYFQPALSAAAVVVVGGAAIAAGVLAYAIANSGEPPEYPALPATSEEERDTAASPPSATRTPTASPVPTASPAAASPTPPAPESSDDAPAIHFWGDVPEYQQVAVRARTASVVEFFEARYGVRVPGLEVHVGADDAALDEATRSAAGAREWVGFAQYRDGLLFIRMDASADAIGHLYFYAIQDSLSPGRGGGPGWLNEGAAAYAAHLYQHARGGRSLDEAMDYNRWASSYVSAPLEHFDAERPAVPQTDASKSLAALAVGWLVEQGGEDSLIAYYRLLPASETWTEAFEAAFGLPFTEVYSAFAAYRAETVAVRRDVSGGVLGPDGKPVEDWRIDIEAYPEGSQHVFGLREDATNEGFSGDFTSRLPDGTYVLALVTRCPGGSWVDLGWYGGESGFTASDTEAAHVVVAGEDIEGLVIRLPSLPDEMFPERCSYGPRVTVSGVVTGLDGRPRPNIYLTSHDPVSGLWPDNAVSAADGSFTLSLPEEAAYRISAAPVCEHKGRFTPVWGGEHRVGGGVDLDADGLLVVGSEDIAGVEVQLQSAFTCRSG